MGFSRKRTGTGGRVRYTAIYRDLRGASGRQGASPHGRRRIGRGSAEVMLGLGRVGDPARGRQTFERYVEDTWFPNHQVEVTTRQRYWYCLRKHILPEFGPMKMVEILPEHVREWVTKMKDRGLSPAMIAENKVILSGIFTTALNDQTTFLHPCKGVKTPTVPIKPYTIITPEQFSAVYDALLDPMWRLLVETDVESGLRWGELTELRVRDIEFSSRMLTVSRAVVQVSPKFHPQTKRFLIKDYPKDREFRRFKLSAQIVAKLRAHVVEHDLGRDALLFWAPAPEGPKVRKLRLVVDPETLGLTEPNAQGRRYRHATMTGYSLGRCRCDYCKDAYARYRADRRAAGKDDPREGRTLDTDGHIPAQWFRLTVWLPALKAANLEIHVRLHDLRHAHASWLLAGGADLQVVKQRLGHGSLRTTERYLHTLPDADETALEALSKIRGRAAQRNSADAYPDLSAGGWRRQALYARGGRSQSLLAGDVSGKRKGPSPCTNGVCASRYRGAGGSW